MTDNDHIVVAAQTLEQGADYLRDLLGVEVPAGGRHQTMSTHNLVMQLGNDAYLEVIAIDPEAEAPRHPRWFALDSAPMRAALEQGPRLITWVMNTSDLKTLAASADFDIGRPTELSRDALRWEFALPDGKSRISSPALTISVGVQFVPLILPPTAMYESPRVLIFSMLYLVVIWSNTPKQ